ncbi:MAG: TonB-dependent receptor [Gammaproteobacteria bacterium]
MNEQKTKTPAVSAITLAVRTLMSAGSLSMLAMSGVHAQEAASAPAVPATAAAPAAAPEVQSVVITGFAASLRGALNQKRNDSGIVDVVKAEDIAKFPDTNLAESLQRIPGVVIDRDAGEGRSITVRGLGQDFTRVRINGIEGLATTGGTDSSGGANRSRGFDFNVFAAELFNSITVRKSSSADVDEGSLGATVDLQTSRPFDFKKFTATASVKGNYNETSRDKTPRVAFLISDTFFDRKMGLLLSAAYSQRKLFEEGFSSVKWDNGPSSGGFCAPIGVPANPASSTATTCGPAAQGVPRLPGTPEQIEAYNTASSPNSFTPRIPRYGRLTHDQDRLGVTASAQFRPVTGTLVTFDMMYSKLDASRQEDFLETFSFSRALGQGGKPQTSIVEALYAPNGSLQYGVFNGVDVRSESRRDELTTTFTQPSLNLKQDIGESITLNANIGRATSKFDNPIQTTTFLDATNVNGYSLDFRGNDRLPKIGYPFDPAQPGGALTIVGVPVVSSGTQPNTIPNTLASEIRLRPNGAKNTNDVANVNLSWEAIPNALTIKGGADYKKFTSSVYESRRMNGAETMFNPPAGTSIASLTTTLTNFGRGLDLPAGTPTSWVIPNLEAITAAYDIYCNCVKSGPAGGPGDFTMGSINQPVARGSNRSVTETDKALFLMGEFSTEISQMPLRGNVGARYVRTHQVATGYLPAATPTEISADNTYSDLLPALNLSLGITKDFLVRLAAAKVMSRPQLASLTPGVAINTSGLLTITSGNPKLDPIRAKTLDTSFEWYFNKGSYLGLGLFYKKIDTYIQNQTQNVVYRNTGLPLSLLPSNFTGDELFQVNTPLNTKGGNLKGFEINYQQPFTFLPGWGKNFGALINFTSVKSKIDYLISPTSTATITDDLLNLSPRAWNATLYYEDGKFSARTSAAYRSGFVSRVPGTNNNDVEGKLSSMNVDASISYKVNEQLDIRFEGINLTNEPNNQFVSRARNNPYVYHVTGREFVLGASYKF